MEIRTYQAGDLTDVVSLWHQCSLVTPQNDPVKDIKRKLKVTPELFLVGVLDDELIATVMGGYEGHRGWINYLAVKPGSQRKQYGQKMMAAIEALLQQRGCPKINLQVRASNKDAIAFYNALGYGDDHVVGLGKRLVFD